MTCCETVCLRKRLFSRSIHPKCVSTRNSQLREIPLRSKSMKHDFTRRTILRGLGVSMALPWLESLAVWGDEPTGGGRGSEAPVRLAVLFAGNGFHSKEWWAKGEGKNMELGKVLAPLTDFHVLALDR